MCIPVRGYKIAQYSGPSLIRTALYQWVFGISEYVRISEMGVAVAVTATPTTWSAPANGGYAVF